MASGHYYLVHFPDAPDSVHNIIGDVGPGTEILDGWIVNETPKLREEEIDGKPVNFEVWVNPTPPPEETYTLS